VKAATAELLAASASFLGELHELLSIFLQSRFLAARLSSATCDIMGWSTGLRACPIVQPSIDHEPSLDLHQRFTFAARRLDIGVNMRATFRWVARERECSLDLLWAITVHLVLLPEAQDIAHRH
jgi:hypothetical protein